MLGTLSACGPSGNSPVTTKTVMAGIPGDLRTCFRKMVPTPKAGEMTKAEAFELIAALKKSEFAKTQCGQRLIRFYDEQKVK